MSSYSTNEFRSGLKIILDGNPYTIVENEFVKPGKGHPFNRVRIRNLRSGRTLERSFRSGETVEAADVVETDMQYLYNDGDFWHFMVPDTSNSTPPARMRWANDDVAQGRDDLQGHALERRAARDRSAGPRRAEDRGD